MKLNSSHQFRFVMALQEALAAKLEQAPEFTSDQLVHASLLGSFAGLLIRYEFQDPVDRALRSITLQVEPQDEPLKNRFYVRMVQHKLETGTKYIVYDHEHDYAAISDLPQQSGRAMAEVAYRWLAKSVVYDIEVVTRELLVG